MLINSLLSLTIINGNKIIAAGEVTLQVDVWDVDPDPVANCCGDTPYTVQAVAIAVGIARRFQVLREASGYKVATTSWKCARKMQSCCTTFEDWMQVPEWQEIKHMTVETCKDKHWSKESQHRQNCCTNFEDWIHVPEWQETMHMTVEIYKDKHWSNDSQHRQSCQTTFEDWMQVPEWQETMHMTVETYKDKHWSKDSQDR